MRSKYTAALSLSIMAVGFLVTLFLPDTTLFFLLKGGFEAGLVGGIADWFAVTALFRHPFGIPIPHTSLLLRNRDKITRSLISAMEQELLNPQSIENKLRTLKLLQSASSLLVKLLRKRSVRINTLEFLIQRIRKIPLDHAVSFVQSVTTGYVRSIDAKTAAESAVTKAIEAGYEQKALDYALVEALNWVRLPQTRNLLGTLAHEKLSEIKTGGFMGFAFQAFAGFTNEQKLGEMLQNLLTSSLLELSDADNVFRQKIVHEIRVRLFEFAGDEERLASVTEQIAGYLQGEEGRAFLSARLEELRGLLVNRLEEEKAQGGRIIFAIYRSIIRSAANEPDLIAQAEHRLLGYIIDLVKANHYRLGQLVKENVDRMDDVSLVRMLEEKVGNDLQWIRVNGAICGFAVGILLSAVQLWIG